MAAEYHSSGEYIKHHLQNLTYGQHPDGTWGFAHGMEEAKAMGFWSINVDSMLFSIGLGVRPRGPLLGHPPGYRTSSNGSSSSSMMPYAAPSPIRVRWWRHWP